jgi:sarcosine oxidase subunit alpha
MPRLPTFAPDCTIFLDGRAVPARRGEPVAAALLAAGRPLISRSAKYHRPRGAFCLAGSCGTCLVRAGGLPSRRSCRTPCRDGLAVETQNAIPDARHDLLGIIDPLTPRGLDHHHLATWSAVANRAAVGVARRLAGLGTLPDAAALPAARAAGPVREETWDVLVAGAGPAGLAAAEALAGAGRRVLLAEREPAIGGRLRCRVEPPGAPDLAWAARVADRVRSAGGEVALGTDVVGLWHDGGAPLAALVADGPSPRVRLARAARIVTCPGATPQPLAIPGGDRPGVYGARGLALALAEHGVVPGERMIILRDGPDARALAPAFARAGMRVDVGPDEIGGRILGRGRVRGIRLVQGGVLPCDTIAVTALAPATELPRALGAEVAWDASAGAFALRADPDGRTGVPGLLAAGEVTGEVGAELAAEAGRRAGEAARG